MRVVVVFASIIIALIVLSLFIVASYGYPQYHSYGHHPSIPVYVQSPMHTQYIPTYAAPPSLTYSSYPSQDTFMTRESYIPAPSHHIPSYSMPSPMITPVQAVVQVPVPVTPVVIPQYHHQPPPPPREAIEDRSSSTEKSSSGGSKFKFGKSLSIPNDFADKLFPFTIRIATHGEPHMPYV
jgi:hypothetical protein